MNIFEVILFYDVSLNILYNSNLKEKKYKDFVSLKFEKKNLIYRNINIFV